jgi:hypothetical protein
MTDLLDLVVLESVLTWGCVIATLALTVALPRWFGLNTLNALAYAQMTLIFNAITIIAGQGSGLIDFNRSMHFFLTEFGFLAITCAIYARMLRYRTRVVPALISFFAGRGGQWLTAFMTLTAGFNLLMAPDEGDSRIAYQTAAWFSLLKPFLQLATPLAYMGVFVMLTMPAKRRTAFVLLTITLAGNVLTGSKASFVFSLLTAYFALRDISMLKALKLRDADRWKLAVIAVLLAVYALVRLEVTPAQVTQRFLLFGEATILTYFSDSPTEACREVSTFASMHRGIARLLGDASANDIDTLFGFALTKMALGINTFTGPNGRLSAYMICNFPDANMLLGWSVIAVYFALLVLLLKRAARKPRYLALFYPYIITSLGLASQDYNLIMADITLASLLLLLLLITTISLTATRRRYAVG